MALRFRETLKKEEVIEKSRENLTKTSEALKK